MVRIDFDYRSFQKFQRRKTESLTDMNFLNATWLSVASLLRQGGEDYPKSFSARIMALAWWLLMVVIVAIYTANLAAWLTASRRDTSINTLADLYGQSKLKYGTMESSAPEQYFRDSRNTMLQFMHAKMKSNGHLFKTFDKAMETVREGDFVMIWDTTVMGYVEKQKPCNTAKMFGRMFGPLGYGFPLQKNSPHRDEFSGYILQLREAGFMDDLTKKWYEERAECSSLTDAEAKAAKELEDAGGQLTLEHMIGIFYIMYGGFILSVIILVVEWFVMCATLVDEKDPMRPNTFCEAFCSRARFLLADLKLGWHPCGDEINPIDMANVPKAKEIPTGKQFGKGDNGGLPRKGIYVPKVAEEKENGRASSSSSFANLLPSFESSSSLASDQAGYGNPV